MIIQFISLTCINRTRNINRTIQLCTFNLVRFSQYDQSTKICLPLQCYSVDPNRYGRKESIRYQLIFTGASKSYYVTKSDKDHNSGTSETILCLTIQKAANSVTPGSTVYIGPGIYYESITINVQGNARDGSIKFTNLLSNDRAVISGKYALVPSEDGTMNLIYMEKKSYLQFSNPELTDLRSMECSRVRIVGGGSHVGTYGSLCQS